MKYMAQFEAKNELPTGKALVRPSSGFVVKCMHKKKREEQDSNGKLFLNIVHSEQVDEPSVLDGSNWSVPFVIGPLRMEHDKEKKNLVATFDCCFHPLIDTSTRFERVSQPRRRYRQGCCSEFIHIIR